MCVCVFVFSPFSLFSLVLDPSLFSYFVYCTYDTHPAGPEEGLEGRKNGRKKARMEGRRPSSLFFFFCLDPVPFPLFPFSWEKTSRFPSTTFVWARLVPFCGCLYIFLFLLPSSPRLLFSFLSFLSFFFRSHIYRYFPFLFFARYRFPGDVIAHRVPHPPSPLYMYKKKAPEGVGREGREWGWGGDFLPFWLASYSCRPYRGPFWIFNYNWIDGGAFCFLHIHLCVV